MAVLIYKSNCRAAASVQNVSYILREDAAAVWGTHNLEDVQTKMDALSYAERRAWEEEMRPLNGAAERRNHNRLELTFASETNPDRALAVAKDFLKQEFPEAKAILAAHGNTKKMHIHAWIDIRKTDGKKVHLSNSQYKTLDSRYAKFMDKIYGTNYAEEFAAKKLANINERERLKAVGRRPVRKQNLTWKKRKEANTKNEQRTTRITESIIEAASRTIDESSRRIAEFEQINSWNRNKSELERIGRSGLERKRSDHDQPGPNSIQSADQNPQRPRHDR